MKEQIILHANTVWETNPGEPIDLNFALAIKQMVTLWPWDWKAEFWMMVLVLIHLRVTITYNLTDFLNLQSQHIVTTTLIVKLFKFSRSFRTLEDKFRKLEHTPSVWANDREILLAVTGAHIKEIIAIFK